MRYIPKVNELQRKREEQGLTRFGLSKKVGMGSSALYRIETGVSPTVHSLTANAIAAALACKVEDIFEAPQRGA